MDEVVLVTGAARGLGREVARQLAEQGRHVVIAARDVEAAAATSKELGGGVSALPVGLDITDPESVRAAAESITRLDVLVNNAAAYVDWTETTRVDQHARHRAGGHPGPGQRRVPRPHRHVARSREHGRARRRGERARGGVGRDAARRRPDG